MKSGLKFEATELVLTLVLCYLSLALQHCRHYHALMLPRPSLLCALFGAHRYRCRHPKEVVMASYCSSQNFVRTPKLTSRTQSHGGRSTAQRSVVFLSRQALKISALGGLLTVVR